MSDTITLPGLPRLRPEEYVRRQPPYHVVLLNDDDHTYEYVMEMLKEHLQGRTDGLVFTSKRRTPLINSTVLNKHLHPLLRKLGLERGGMHGFRHHRVSTLVMAGTSIGVIKKWIGHGSEEMVNRYTHLRPDFMRSELERVPDFTTKLGTEIAEIDPVDPVEVAA